MTTANKITLTRIALIPVFVLFTIYYGISFAAGKPQEWLRWAGVGAFGLAALSDGLDGFIARRYNQRTELGVLLDPIADKGLLLAGIITLSFSGWAYELPVWFAILVVARDLIVGMGALVWVLLQGTTIAVRTTWTGKMATALQMVTLVAVMWQPAFLRLPVGGDGAIGRFFEAKGWHVVWLDLPVIIAALFTAVSGIGYSARGLTQMHLGGHGDPKPWPGKDAEGANSVVGKRK
ncbi:MAG: CDP-diacylglycerol--glycerol-3-phosphate 3-phosphatidyltransferase [Verrucomicrobiota bacterium]